ncbi:MAG: hypothetical protein HY296_01585 [Thaumarchaeota archaeon]|nr:hypothetical protein [Nitrososphaerota archaeon]
MNIDPFLARILFTVLTILLVLSLFELALGLAATDAGAVNSAVVLIVFIGAGLAVVGYAIRRQAMREQCW